MVHCLLYTDIAEKTQGPPRLVSTVSHRSGRSSVPAPVLANGAELPRRKGADAPEPNGTSSHVPNVQLLVSRTGLTLLSPQNLNNESRDTFDVDVIAIHGLNGHPRETWTHADRVFWLEDLLPKALPGARIFTYGYDSRLYWSTSMGDLKSYAEGLLHDIDLVRHGSEVST